jgi:hypothetical protein
LGLRRPVDPTAAVALPGLNAIEQASVAGPAGTASVSALATPSVEPTSQATRPPLAPSATAEPLLLPGSVAPSAPLPSARPTATVRSVTTGAPKPKPCDPRTDYYRCKGPPK